MLGKGEPQSTGAFHCDGIKLSITERQHFERKLQDHVKSLYRYSIKQQTLDDLVSVEFKPVIRNEKDLAAHHEHLCVVKIHVKYFHGLIWPEKEGPIAYKALHEEQESKIRTYSFEEWSDAFRINN